MYVTLTELKKQLNIDTAFTDDDTYLESLEAAGEEVVSKYINRELSDIVDSNNKLPASVKHAILLWVSTAYEIRESVSNSSMVPVHHSFDLLCDLWRKYD